MTAHEDGHEYLNLLMVDDKIPAGASFTRIKKLVILVCKFYTIYT